MASKERIQEDQYEYPYHYRDLVSEYRKYVWDVEALLNITNVADMIKDLGKKSVLDIGCGDGRLIYELNKRGILAEGVDISEAALGFAQAFNPKNKFYSNNIITKPLKKRYDVITSIEVVEHIPPKQLPVFVRSMKKHVKKDGVLLLTTPSTNLPLLKKHYQHFSEESLRNILKKQFVHVKIIGLHKKTRMVGIIKLLTLAQLVSKTFFFGGKKISGYHKKIFFTSPEKAQRWLAICSDKPL